MEGAFTTPRRWLGKTLRCLGNISRRFDYEVLLLPTRDEPTEYVRCLPYRYNTYCGWVKEEFQEICSKVQDKTACTEERLYLIREFSHCCTDLEGDFAECGVYRGGSAAIIAGEISHHELRREFHLFDTFTGFPDMKGDCPAGHKEGDFGDTSLDYVRDCLQEYDFVRFHPGLMPNSFSDSTERKFAFVHVDVDLYQPGIDCCRFFYHRMTKRGMLLFDDYGIQGFESSIKRAVDEFFRDKSERPISLRSGQCLVVKD